MYDNCHAWHFLILGDSGLVKEMPSGRRGCLCTAVGLQAPGGPTAPQKHPRGPQGISISSRITLKNGHDKKGRTHPMDACSLSIVVKSLKLMTVDPIATLSWLLLL